MDEATENSTTIQVFLIKFLEHKVHAVYLEGCTEK